MRLQWRRTQKKVSKVERKKRENKKVQWCLENVHEQRDRERRKEQEWKKKFLSFSEASHSHKNSTFFIRNHCRKETELEEREKKFIFYDAGG